MKCKFLPVAAALLLASLMALSCEKDNSKPGNESEAQEVVAGDPIKVIDGKVRFFIDVDNNAPRVLAGVEKSKILERAEKLYVNGKAYPISADENGNLYSDVYENSEGTYSAALSLKGESNWFDQNPGNNLTIPCGQFYGNSSEDSFPLQFPLFGKYSEATGNRMYLSDITGVLRLNIKGTGSVVSVKLQTDGGAPAGTYLRSSSELLPSENTEDFVVLNCTEEGRNVEMDNNFDLFLAPGNYTSSQLIICDSNHRVMRIALDLNVRAGELVSTDITFTPDADVLWYEGFDLCVWGGNIMGGSSAKGFSPAKGTVNSDYGKTLTGREYALTAVDYNVAGSGYIQPDVWNDVSGSTVGKTHQMSESYIKSRNFSDYNMMFRTQEFQGMMGVSYYKNTARGILATPAFTTIEGFRKVKVTVRFCPGAGFTDEIHASVRNGGMIESVALDSGAITLKSLTYNANSSEAVLSANAVTGPSDMSSPNAWHTLDLVVNNATNASYLYFCANTTGATSHNLFIDSVEVTDLGLSCEKGNSLRVLYWNIQNGMWADQANNYDNFVEWVKKYDPDVCVWCESATIYKDNTNKAASAEEKYLPNGWAALASRYGHNYSAQGGFRDNYPQEITSKYPITTLLKITDTDDPKKPITHGAAIQQLDINGKKLNVVTLHMWPQKYAYGASDQTASGNANEGDYYREYEMNYILSHTINASEYSSQTDWLMMGDFNSRSEIDEWKYKYAGKYPTYYLCQNVIKNNSSMVDIIGNFYPGYFLSSTAGSSRIDYMYASPSMYPKIKNAITVIDSFTTLKADTKYGTAFYIPSDHRPIMVDFEY